MSKKKWIILSVSLMFTVILVVTGTFYFFKEAGAMEQIFRAAKTGSFKAFNEVPELKSISYEDLHQFENFGD